MRDRLITLIQTHAQDQGTDFAGAFRDCLTDLRHIADTYAVDFDRAVDGSGEVYEEEKELAEG